MKILFFLIFSVIFAKEQSWDEKLLYNASFGGVDVATATLKSKKFKNIQNQDILRIEFKAKSKPSLKYIFPINDKIIIDKNEVYEDGRLLSNSPVNFIITTQSNKKFFRHLFF